MICDEFGIDTPSCQQNNEEEINHLVIKEKRKDISIKKPATIKGIDFNACQAAEDAEYDAEGVSHFSEDEVT